MTIKSRKFSKGIRTKPTTDAATLEGEQRTDSASNKQKIYLGGSERSVVTEDQTQTLTNKTHTDPVLNGDVSGTSIDTDVNLAADSDTKIASQKAVKAYVDAAVETVNDASEINYSNATSGLTATDVQAAVDEVEGRLDTAEGNITTNASAISDHIADAVDAHDASAISNVPSGNLAATDVQGALNELQTELDGKALSSDLSDHISDTVDAHDASAISNIPSGNLAATEVQAALNELQSDIDTRALDSALTSHTGASSAHGISGNVVGTSDTQTLTNKTIDGATITSPVQSDVKKDTQANLETYASTATNGQFCFATDTKQAYQIIDNALAPIGGGSGGLDVFYTETFEGAIKAANFTSGNNATFDNGGTLDGTLADETSSPVAGDTSLKYTMGASSTNDFIKSPDITLDAKQKGQTVGMEFYYTYDGDDNDIAIVAYDDTNSQVLTSSVDFLKAASTPQRFSVQFPTNSNTATLNWGIQVVTGNSGAILVIDDVQISTNPYVSKDLVSEKVVVRAEGNSGTTTTANVTDITWSTILEDELSLWDGTTFTVPVSGMYEIYGSIDILTQTTFSIDVYIDGVQDKRIRATGTGSMSPMQFSHKDYYSVGQMLTFRSTASHTLVNTANEHFLCIEKTPEATEHVIAYNSRNAENSSIELHTANGYGSTNDKIRRFSTVGKNVGNDLTLTQSATDGDSIMVNSKGVYHIAYNDNFSGAEFIGVSLNSTQLTTNITAITAADRKVMGYTSSVNTPDAVAVTLNLDVNDVIRFHTNGTTGGTSSRTQATVTKIGVGDLLGVPVPRTCYIKDVKASGTNGGTFTSGAWRTRDLNTLEGDTEFVSLSANQFVLSEGKYEIEIEAPAYEVNQHKAKLVNIDDTVDVIIGSSSYSQITSGKVQSVSSITGTITITSPKTFEVQHRCNTTGTTNGFGTATVFGVDEIYTICKITKIS